MLLCYGNADLCLSSHQSQGRLADLVAEHLDHLHYLNDILCLEIGDLNCVLTDQLLHRLLLPLYVLSLAPRTQPLPDAMPQVCPVCQDFCSS